jgi:hypothetical protein
MRTTYQVGVQPPIEHYLQNKNKNDSVGRCHKYNSDEHASEKIVRLNYNINLPETGAGPAGAGGSTTTPTTGAAEAAGAGVEVAKGTGVETRCCSGVRQKRDRWSWRHCHHANPKPVNKIKRWIQSCFDHKFILRESNLNLNCRGFHEIEILNLKR